MIYKEFIAEAAEKTFFDMLRRRMNDDDDE